MERLRSALALGGLVGLVADQRPAAGRQSVTAALMGRPSEFSPGLAALHSSTGAPVWFAAIVVDERDGRAALRLHLQRLAPRVDTAGGEPSTPVEGAVLMQRYADAITALVAAVPAQYFWFHRRWRDVHDG